MKLLYAWGIPGAAFLIWMVLTFTIVPALMRRLRKKGDESRQRSDNLLSSVLGTPLILFILVLGLKLFLDAIPSIPAKWDKYTDALFLILFALAVYLFVDRLMIEILRRYGKNLEIVTSSEGMVKAIYRSIILIFIILIILDSLKITITPFIASLGIGGVVIGLALQDTLSNFFSGIYIRLDKPIRIGDYVKLDPGEGYVAHVGWRSTRIRTLFNKYLILPNSKVTGSAITNFSLPGLECGFSVNVAVSYDSDLEKVERVTIEVAKEVLRETEGSVKEFQPSVGYNSFGDSGIKFSVNLQAREYINQYLIIHEFIKRLHKRYRSEGIEIPFPTRTIYTKNGDSKKEVSSLPPGAKPATP